MTNKIMMHMGDFHVCKAALVQAEVYWQHAIDTKNLPDKFTEPDARFLLDKIVETREKIEGILLMQTAVADYESYDDIFKVIGDEDKTTIH